MIKKRIKAPSIENITIWRNQVYNLEKNSMKLFDEIMELLDRIEPMRSNNNYKRVWLNAERGSVSDMRFNDLDDAMDYFEVDNEADLHKKFLEMYPDEKYWFMLESVSNEDARILIVQKLAIIIYTEMPEHIDDMEHDYSNLLEWVKESLTLALSQAEKRMYVNTVEKELPYSLRYGTITRRKLYERRPSCMESILKDLPDEEIDRFIQTIEKEGENYIPEDRIKDMTFNMYFDYASKAFNAAGYDTKGMTPYEQFRRYGEDFGGFILENLPHDTPEGFLFFCDDRNHAGGHPWGLVRGSSRTRLFLWPRQTDEGFYFTFSGNEVFMAYEMVRMYMALKDCGMPVRYGSCKKDIIEYLRQNDLIGIVPAYEIALYRQHEFPNQEVEDFMHFYPEEDSDIADLIEWQPIMPIVFKGERHD